MIIDEKDISHLNGHQFEDLIEQLIKKMGFIVEERKLTVDGGIDILAKSYQPIFEGTYVIQCKRYTHKVGESTVRDLYGVVHSKNANKGILITNSTFTKAAIEFAQNKQLELIDGEKLRSLLLKYEIAMPEKRTVILPNYVRFLNNSFVPALRKIRDQVEDIKNQRVYIEKTIYNEKHWINLLQSKLHKLESYCIFVTNIFNQSLTPTFLEKEPNMQQIKSDCEKIIDATEKIVEDYKSLYSGVPPERFSMVHEKFLGIYPPVFETISRLADDIENIEKATARPEPQASLTISVVFDGKAIEEFNKAVKEVMTKEKTQLQKSWWL